MNKKRGKSINRVLVTYAIVGESYGQLYESIVHLFTGRVKRYHVVVAIFEVSHCSFVSREFVVHS